MNIYSVLDAVQDYIDARDLQQSGEGTLVTCHQKGMIALKRIADYLEQEFSSNIGKRSYLYTGVTNAYLVELKFRLKCCKEYLARVDDDFVCVIHHDICLTMSRALLNSLGEIGFLVEEYVQ